MATPRGTRRTRPSLAVGEVRGLVEDVLRGEIVFPRRFAKVEERAYGLLYHADEVPDSHDGNHACVLRGGDLPGVVADVEAFYRGRGLTPRVYHLSRRGQGEDLRRALSSAGFRVVEQGSGFYVHRRPSSVVPTGEVTVHRVRTAWPDLLAMIRESDSDREAEVVRRSLACPDFHLLVGSSHGRPVTVAAVERAGPVARVDHVLTHVACRGRGHARAVVHELVRYHTRAIGGTLCLCAGNPTAARIYEEAGFDRLADPLDSWAAWKD